MSTFESASLAANAEYAKAFTAADKALAMPPAKKVRCVCEGALAASGVLRHKTRCQAVVIRAHQVHCNPADSPHDLTPRAAPPHKRRRQHAHPPAAVNTPPNTHTQ